MEERLMIDDCPRTREKYVHSLRKMIKRRQKEIRSKTQDTFKIILIWLWFWILEETLGKKIDGRVMLPDGKYEKTNMENYTQCSRL